MSVLQLDELRQRLKSLRLRHRELDEKISDLAEQAYMDSLELQRMKKRKLALKDTIVRLESQLIPDMNA